MNFQHSFEREIIVSNEAEILAIANSTFTLQVRIQGGGPRGPGPPPDPRF